MTATGRGVTVLGMDTQTSPDAWRPLDTLANRLILVRRALGLNQREAAEKTGISFGEWQSMENGAAARGIDRKVAAISAALRVDRDWLMWGGALAEPSGSSPIRQYLADNGGEKRLVDGVEGRQRTREESQRRRDVARRTRGDGALMRAGALDWYDETVRAA